MKFAKYLTAFSVFSVVAGVTLPTQAVTTTFTDRSTFESSLGSTPIIEDFNDEATSTLSTGNTEVLDGFDIFIDTDAGDTIGIRSGSNGGNIDATQFFGWSGSNASPTFTVSLDNSSTAFGFDFNDTDSTDSYQIEVLSTGETFESPPFSISGSSSGFFGIQTDSPFTEVQFSQTAQGGVVGNFGVDNLTTSSNNSQPVPFEAEGTTGLVALGGFFGYRHLKNRKKRNQTLSQESN